MITSDLLYCGAAKRKITPSEDMLEDLRGLKDQRIGGILDDLYVRVIALQSGWEILLLITFDLDKVPDPGELLALLTGQFPVKEENILLAAVHTHSAPVTGKRPFEQRNDMTLKPEKVQQTTHLYEAYIRKCLVQAVGEAIENMAPARMGSAIGESYINVNRIQRYEYTDEEGIERVKYALGTDPAADVDRSVNVIAFENLKGEKVAFLINYAVHCCVMHGNKCCNGKLGISSDIGGNVSMLMEKRYPNAVALWCSGAAGDINPIMQNEVYYPDPQNGRFTVSALSGGSRDILHLLVNRHLDDIVRTLRHIENTEDKVCLSGCAAYSVSEGKSGDYRVRLHLMKIGQTYLLGIGGELYSSYLRHLRMLFNQEKIIVINHDASLITNAGYIMDDETLLLKEADLPGIHDTNMLPGTFTAAFLKKVREMKRKLDAAQSCLF